MGLFFRFLPILDLLWLFSVFGFVTVGLFTITRLPVSVRWSFVSVRVLMTVSVLLRILVSISVSVSVIQRADSGWPSPSVFFDVIVFGWNGIVTVFDIQGLFFVIFLSISIFTDFFDGIINVTGVVLRSVGFFVSIRTAITMLLVSAIHRPLVTVGIVAIGRLVSVVIVSAVSWLLVTIGFLAIGRLVFVVVVPTVSWRLLVTIGFLAIAWLVTVVVVSSISWLLITVGIMAICWLVSVVAVSAINRLLVTVSTIGFWRLISVLRLVSIRFFPIFIGFVFVLFYWRIRRWCFLPTFVSLLT